MVDILAIGAHPDDIEFGCGGILAKMAAQGRSILMMDLTLGEKGTHGDPEIRRKEGIDAAKVIGAERVALDFKDCEVFDTYENRLKMVREIRKHKPRLILVTYWTGTQNHPDHLATGTILRHACRYARFRNILPELEIHWVDGILHYGHANVGEPDFLVDISDYVEVWKEMMACHKSQMSTFDYIDWNLRVASKNGVMIGAKYAQALLKSNPIVIDDLMSISKSTREI